MFGMNMSSARSGADPWPLRFRRHNFDAYCYNTRRCSVIYDKFQYSLHPLEPSPPPPEGDYRSRWSATNIIGDRFATSVQADWTSLDGSVHHAEIDLAEIFNDRLVLHHVARDDIPEGWLDANAIDPIPAQILMEVNDRLINVYMQAHIATKSLRDPGNEFSDYRKDLVLAWTHTY